MKEKNVLLTRAEKILDQSGYHYAEYDGCFNLVARKRSTLLLKILNNVDSFQLEQSINLKILSEHIDASPAIIGSHTRREKLDDNIVYERFGVPTITIDTFENMIINEVMPAVYRFRGGLFSEIDPIELKRGRMSVGLTQQELAEKIGVSKKNIYEHEHDKKFSLYKSARKMENVLGHVIIKTIDIRKFDIGTNNNPKTGKLYNKFERDVSMDLKKLGFDTNFVGQTPFNIIAKEKMLILSDAEKNEKRIEKNAPYMKKFSDTTKKPVLVITEDELDFDIPSVTREVLDDMESSRELIRILKKF